MTEHATRQDKEQRLRAAMFLLQQIRRNGGKVRDLAAMLKISETQLAHWRSANKKRRLRVGPPTQLQLRIMAGYLEHLVIGNLESLQDVLAGQQLGPVERTHLLVSLTPVLKKKAEAWDEDLRAHLERHAQLLQTLRVLYETGGFAAMPLELVRSAYDIADVQDRQDLEDGRIEFERLLVRASLPYMEQFVTTTRTLVDGLLANVEEQRERKKLTSGSEDGAEEDATP